jgi:hypothetical protein
MGNNLSHLKHFFFPRLLLFSFFSLKTKALTNNKKTQNNQHCIYLMSHYNIFFRKKKRKRKSVIQKALTNKVEITETITKKLDIIKLTKFRKSNRRIYIYNTQASEHVIQDII